MRPACLGKSLVSPLMRRLRRLLLGDCPLVVAQLQEQLADQRARGDRLGGRVEQLERVLDLLADAPEMQWLYANRAERMDATCELFDPIRRQFHLARYRFAAQYVQEKVVADIACGTGYGAELLLTGGRSAKVFGVDVDAKTVAYASRRHKPDGVEFFCAAGDATGLPAVSVDVVISFETIEHVADDRALLAEFQRILRPGGVLLCSTPDDWPLSASPYHVRSYNRAGFRAALEEFFAAAVLYGQVPTNGPAASNGSPDGIWLLRPDMHEPAECLIAVCRRE